MTSTFLKNDFFTLNRHTATGDQSFLAEIALNAAHPVFKGHFEQMPVVPGVFQTQVIKELLQEQVGANLLMVAGNNIKFMSMIVPAQHPQVNVEISYRSDENKWLAEARLFWENTTFTKFKGSFILL